MNLESLCHSLLRSVSFLSSTRSHKLTKDLIEDAKRILSEYKLQQPTDAEILKRLRPLYNDQAAADLASEQDLCKARVLLSQWYYHELDLDSQQIQAPLDQ